MVNYEYKIKQNLLKNALAVLSLFLDEPLATACGILEVLEKH